jgi:hypothetical protein
VLGSPHMAGAAMPALVRFLDPCSASDFNLGSLQPGSSLDNSNGSQLGSLLADACFMTRVHHRRHVLQANTHSSNTVVMYMCYAPPPL